MNSTIMRLGVFEANACFLWGVGRDIAPFLIDYVKKLV